MRWAGDGELQQREIEDHDGEADQERGTTTRVWTRC
jgi:hypothetical protein